MIIQDSIYAKKFTSNELTVQKYDELYAVAVLIRNHKNDISRYICSHLKEYLEMSTFDFVKQMRAWHDAISSSFSKQLYEDVLNAYQNKFDAIKHRLEFQIIQYVECELYKRNTKDKKKGDFKRVKKKKSKSPLTIALTYLSRYGNENSLEYVKSMVNDEKKGSFYQSILNTINKFGFDRLYRLAIARRERIFSIYKQKPIEFKSLTFRGRSRKTKILAYNKNFGSVINAFISLSGFSKKSFDIPVKFNKDYHGSIYDYEKVNPDYEYTIIFDEKRKQVNVILSKKSDRFIPEAGNNIIGIDVNVKHNMLTLSNGMTYDYDRQLLKDHIELSKKINKYKKENKEYRVGKRKQRKLDVISHKEKEHEKQVIAEMCKELESQGINHIVMEDLDGKFSRCYIKDKVNDDVNYNRITRFLKINSIKDEVEHIARKYGIAVSTVHASYTSKMCPVCGCIEDENRPNQETFNCIECGYSSNADLNAAINIRNRVDVTVLRDKLLNKLDNGAYEPKKLEREKVKDVLLSFRRNLQKNARSERIEGSVTTFEHV